MIREISMAGFNQTSAACPNPVTAVRRYQLESFVVPRNLGAYNTAAANTGATGVVST